MVKVTQLKFKVKAGVEMRDRKPGERLAKPREGQTPQQQQGGEGSGKAACDRGV